MQPVHHFQRWTASGAEAPTCTRNNACTPARRPFDPVTTSNRPAGLPSGARSGGAAARSLPVHALDLAATIGAAQQMHEFAAEREMPTAIVSSNSLTAELTLERLACMRRLEASQKRT